jgi:polynucleotide 5'-hydroxyl-kinase GRC3/NOL9
LKIIVEAGKTLLIDGPASVTLVSGRVEVFGYNLRQMDKVLIRDGKRMPFVVTGTATFDISLGENANVEEVEGSTIPLSWERAYEELAAFKKRPTVTLVLGNVDSGKTSFCTYLTNKLLSSGYKVTVLDGDLGQSDIGPPCTVAYAVVSKPLTDLFTLKPANAYFVGVTSPNKALEKVIHGIVTLKEEALKHGPDYLIVNTDGWVEGEEAVNYKLQLIEKISPDIIFCLQQNEILTPLVKAIKNFKTITIESPKTIKQRNREKRKSLRELGYIKYLKGAKVQSIPISWVKIEGEKFFSGLNKIMGQTKREKEICELLGIKPLFIVELKDEIHIVVGRGRQINPENVKKTEEVLGKKVKIIWKGDEEGFLTALYDSENRFLGIGVLREIDYIRKVLKIYTPISTGIAMIIFGKIRLDRNLRETQTVQEETKYLNLS